MASSTKLDAFKKMHNSTNPLLLYNVWDAASTKAVAKAGAKAIATGSWAVAAAQGYKDGSRIPLDFKIRIIERIIASTDLPCTIDFEGGYAEKSDEVAENTILVLEAGAIGINFEDQVIGENRIYETTQQYERINAIRQKADSNKAPLFINARTDLFLQAGAGADHASILTEAKIRAKAYADAGADGLFVPGLLEPTLIAELCDVCTLPVNIMMNTASAPSSDLMKTGVSRISFGPMPFLDSMAKLEQSARRLY
jgi:2-methylisocitrate lyase-like PEP mutase family enzyme